MDICIIPFNSIFHIRSGSVGDVSPSPRIKDRNLNYEDQTTDGANQTSLSDYRHDIGIDESNHSNPGGSFSDQNNNPLKGMDLNDLAKMDRSEIIKFTFFPDASNDYTELILSNMEKELEHGSPTEKGTILQSMVSVINVLQSAVIRQTRLKDKGDLEDKKNLLEMLVNKIKSFSDKNYFVGANLSGKNLRFFNASALNLDLRNAEFNFADLRYADLSHANLIGAEFDQAVLILATFDSAILPVSIQKNPTFFETTTVIHGKDMQFIGEAEHGNRQRHRQENSCCSCTLF